MKPPEYREACTVIGDINYQVEEGQLQGTHSSSGSLNIGRVVYLQHSLEEIKDEASVSAYIEGIGIVSLDPHCLSTDNSEKVG